jgi:hypothetical protein
MAFFQSNGKPGLWGGDSILLHVREAAGPVRKQLLKGHFVCVNDRRVTKAALQFSDAKNRQTSSRQFLVG